MAKTRCKPGEVRDAIVSFLQHREDGATMDDIVAGVEAAVARAVPRSSVRSYLALNSEGRSAKFERLWRGLYKLKNP